MDARKRKKKSEADNNNHWKHKVRPSGDYYSKVKPNSEGSTAKGSNNDGVAYDVPMRWMDIEGRSWMIGDAGRLSAIKHASATGKSVRKNAVPWETTHCAKILGIVQPGVKPEYYQGKSVVTSEGEYAHLDSHVIFRQPVDRKLCIGRIREILVSSQDGQTADHVTLQLFTFAAALHPSLHLPCIDLTDNEMVSTGIDIICAVNIQHNCLDSQCTDIQQQPLKFGPWPYTN
ncbi:hypothetical protein DFJ58DRAFT_846707 [Suillus subalutaceus]|uniref:uncharacterized protein n=1 Tax=Suillus subalutaceus TaxID=48586 RepID=UPI001B85EBED|nr:uncharacterized protein DFJ58DRAFT_846707 [Suillus subalutaceus]KAG1836865.1 hypothetical protein DFJ58DRAFT_846707 [Suillus subalutaceus]